MFVTQFIVGFTMAGVSFYTQGETIKIFQTIERIHHQLGILPVSPEEERSAFRKRVFFLTSLNTYTFLSVVFIIFEARTVQESGESFYIATATLCTTCFYLNFKWNMSNIMDLTKKFNDFFQESKRKSS